MNKAEFIKQLRSTAEELTPLTQASSAGSAFWDGVNYIETNENKAPDPYALAWWIRLLTIAGLIEAQESPLSPKQITYLTQVLFGGMGSFNDLSFDPKSLGNVASAINQRLKIKRRDLFENFRD